MIRPYPRYAELHARRRQPGHVQRRRSARPAGAAQARVDGSGLAATRRDCRRWWRSSATTAKRTRRVLRESRAGAPAAPSSRRIARPRPTGRVELSTSPFYHPILPLLCDTDVHLRAHPQSALPRGLFARPDDARAATRARVRLITRSVFGSPPRGVWPSEGSVSDEVVRSARGVRAAQWTATDEDILARSLQPRGDRRRSVTARTSRAGQAVALSALFRDHRLSDLIGFAYQSWDADAAADDFLRPRARGGARALSRTAGEAPRGHRDSGRRECLGALRRRRPPVSARALLSGSRTRPTFKTVTMARRRLGRRGRCRRFSRDRGSTATSISGQAIATTTAPGRSWRRRAQAFDAASDRLSPEARAQALEELLIAEGSDWFWWYGDDHSSDHDREFDDLFRRHLRNVYRALGLAAPTSFTSPTSRRSQPRRVSSSSMASSDARRTG